MKDKYVKIPYVGPIFPLSVNGPINTPMRLALKDILTLLATEYPVVECVKDYKTDKFIGELKLTKDNYNLNNYYKVKPKQNKKKQEDVIQVKEAKAVKVEEEEDTTTNEMVINEDSINNDSNNQSSRKNRKKSKKK